jgi:succinoglycan biosynthesis transport protein ExoP
MSEGPAPFDPFAASPTENGFDYSGALSFLWRRWKFIAVVLALVVVVGTLYRLHQTPLYTATTEILFDQPRERAPDQGALLNNYDLDAAVLEGQMALIRSTVFLRYVVERAHLASGKASTADKGSAANRRPKSPSVGGLPQLLSSFFSSLLSYIDGSAPADPKPAHHQQRADRPGSPAPGPDSIPPAEMRAIAALSGALEVRRVAQDGYVIAISVTSSDPARAARLANAVADTYLVDKSETRLDAAKRASAWLSGQLIHLRKQLQASEEALARFRVEHGLVASDEGALTKQQVAQLRAELAKAQADLIRNQVQVEMLDRARAKGGSLINMPGIANAGTLPGLEIQESALSAQEVTLLAQYTAANPFVANIRAQLHAQLRATQNAIAAEAERLAAGIRSDYQLDKLQVASLERALQQATGQSPSDATPTGIAITIRLHELERTVAANKVLFEDFLKQAKATQAQSTFQPQDARIITPAGSGTPDSSGKIRFMAGTLFLGMLLGTGGAFLKEKLDSGFTTPRQLREQLGLPLLASLSHIAGRELKVEHSVVPIYDLPIAKPLSHFGEAMRSLRSVIRIIDIEHPPTVIQMASSLPGEGKTTIGLSLAASAAGARLKVLFIDADLRHSTATRVFGRLKEPGLVDLLLNDATIEDVARVYELGGYWTIGAGARTQHPTDLLGSERMKTIIATFREHFDLVIIDTPPVGPVMDPVIVSHLCDKILFVVKWDATAREIVKASVERLSGSRKLAGVAFNQVNDRQARRYGKDAYAHYPSSLYYKKYYGE